MELLLKSVEQQAVAMLLSFFVGVTIMYLVSQRQIQNLKGHVNLTIDKGNAKVVHTCDVGEIEDAGKKVYCRCWRSSKFPFCDGTHVKHNKDTGDNVGPLIVQKKGE